MKKLEPIDQYIMNALFNREDKTIHRLALRVNELIDWQHEMVDAAYALTQASSHARVRVYI